MGKLESLSPFAYPLNDTIQAWISIVLISKNDQMSFPLTVKIDTKSSSNFEGLSCF